MIRFTLFGIQVQVQVFFWITLALIGGAMGANSPEALMKLALFMLAGFISLLVHELGHALTARHFGAHSEIVLQAFGGYATVEGIRLTRMQNFLVTAAGPAVQLVLGFGLLQVLPILPKELNPNMIYFFKTLIWVSIVWAALNLLPILPLDGGQLLNAILGTKRIRITLWTSIIVAIAAGGIAFYYTTSILMPLFMGMFAWQAWQALRQQP
jgi:Zn-dependent protease